MTPVNGDGTFDSNAQPVTTSGTWQEVLRLQSRGKRVLASVILGGNQTIGDFRILQAAFPDDPNPQVIADGNGFNSPALANESYIIPPMSLPIAANSVFQVHIQGDASELIFQANTAGGNGATMQIKGTAVGRLSH
jgi:hypothetical protein